MISWDVAEGLVVTLNQEEVGRSPISSEAPENAEAQYFVIGYPGFSYTESYEVNLLIREFTVSPVSRQQTSLAFGGEHPGAYCSS